MHTLKRILTGTMAGLFITVGLFVLVPASSVNALVGGDWRSGRITDDAIFNNNASMSVAQVQQFLNAKVPTCDRWGTQPYGGTTRRAHSESKGVVFPLTCLKDYYENPTTHENNLEGRPVPGGGQSAAQIIWNVSQQFTVNPQTLIVLLQKEQSLVFDDWPWPKQFQIATGYACPDSAPCDSQYFGFYNQVYNAARQFRRYAQNPNNYNFVPHTNNTVAYNPNPGCGAANFFIESQATASLYNYTPYVPNGPALGNLYGSGDGCSAYGNRNYWRMFNDWFGPTIGTKILKKDGDPAFYLYNDGKKIKVPSFALYKAYGFDKIGVTLVSNAYLDGLPAEDDLTPLARGGDGTVHLVSHGKRYILSGPLCTDWGLECANPYVVTTMDSDMLNVPNYAGMLQPLMRNSAGAIFKMVNGTKQPFLNMDAINQNGYNFAQITEVDDMSAGQPLGPLLPSEGVALKLNGSSALLLYTGGQYVAVDSIETFYAWALDKVYYPTVPASTLDSSPPATSGTLSSANRITTYSGKKYLIDGARKIDLSQVSGEWPAGGSTAFAPNAVARLSVGGVPNASTCYRSANGSIFQVENSTKRAIRSYDDVYRLNCSPETLVNVSDASVAGLTSGADKLTLSRPFKKPSDDGIYLVGDGGVSTRIASYSTFVALGLVPEDVYNANAATATAYATSGDTTSYGQKNGVFYIYSPKGVKYHGTSDILSLWGVSNYGPVFGGVVGDRLATSNNTRFAHTQSGAIYYASAGSKHLLTSYDAYARLGGVPANTMEVMDDFLATVPTGSSIN